MKVLHTLGRVFFASSMILALASAQAAPGYSVWPRDENMVKIGMTMDEVRQALGRPSQSVKYRNEPGPTWTYNVNGYDDDYERPVFEVNFSADGKVASVAQRMAPSYSSGNH